MRNAVQLIAIFLLSALATVALVTMRTGGPQWARSIVVSQSERDRASPGEAPPPRLVAAERLREVQDQYLKILQGSPRDAEAFRGLVAVRRQLAGEDATALRQQAAAYRQLIARGADAPGHYSRESLERLASASLQAAKAIDAERRVNTAPKPTAAEETDPQTIASPASRGSIAEGSHGAPQAATPSAPAPKPVTSLGVPTPPTATPPAATPPTATPPAAGAPAATASATVPSQPIPAPAQPPMPTTVLPASSKPVAPPSPPAPPASAQPSSAEDPSAETVAVVSPPANPALMEGQGSLVKVDCQNRTFMLRGSAGDEEYLVPEIVTIYVRGVRSERLKDFCGLQRFVGQKAVAWSTMDGDRRVARWISVLLSAAGHRVAPGMHQENFWWGHQSLSPSQRRASAVSFTASPPRLLARSEGRPV